MMRKTDWFHLSVDGWTLSIHSYINDTVVMARFSCGEVSILKHFDLEKKDFKDDFWNDDCTWPKVSSEVCRLFARLALE